MTPGFHKITMPEYLALDCVSSGLLNTLLMQSPYHARYQQQNPEADDTAVSDLGTAVHDALLEGVDRIASIAPELYRSKPTKANPEGNVPKGWTNGAIKAARDEARAAGKLPMLAGEVERVTNAVAAIKAFVNRKDCEIRGCFDDGQPEVTGVWEGDGTLCKLRADWLTTKWHISVKTTDGSARPDSWIRRQMGPMGYDVQLSFYERGLTALGRGVQHRILLCEQNPPYGCVVVGLAPSRAEFAAARVSRALATWGACAKRNYWPAYPAETHFAEVLPWEDAAEAEAQAGFTPEQLSAGIPL